LSDIGGLTEEVMKLAKTLMGALLAIGACTTATAEIPDEKQSVRLNTYILLDRTGSMSDLWDEALSSVNAYVGSVIEPDDGPQVDNDITLSVFDAQDGLQYDTLRRNVTGEGWKALTNDEVHPRGTTPLLDAIGRTVAMAESDAPEKAVIVIMTDGKENASREFSREGVRSALSRVEDKGWEVVFLGAEFASFGDADAAGVDRSRQMAVSKDRLSQTMDNLAKKNRAYAQELADDVEFNEADRAIAEEEDVKQRKGTN
tara:strand:+ start:29836 stop:30609 length:774 start_codon:yes stop_codon:yes gene_type:complete